MSNCKETRRAARAGLAGLAALVLCFVLLLSCTPVGAAEWMEPYLEQVTEWGVMRGDSSGNLNEDRAITRAEFVVMMNRAFGYTEVGPNPFSDVLPTDWFAEDIAIAHQAGYFNGTSATTAAPRNLVTREQAAALLARCMRMQGTTGARTKFEDGDTISPTFRGLVQEAAELGIIQGYSNGNFAPKQHITRGQMACFLVRALGTLVQEPGEQIEGGVYGNLTINTSGVKLKDTTITGNLYLTGGVGLGNVELENVNVMGKIVVCGGGSSEKGQNSVVLRNVSAEALEVDSLSGQFLSVKAEGLTDIGTTTVRTSSFLEDITEDGLGLQVIRLEGDSGTQMQVAGNIKEIVNLTPASSLDIAQGIAGLVTMDEKAVGATLNIANGASVGELNLDTATPVTGTGSVKHMQVNAAGSSITMLPDTIDVRPGINANINGETMDTVAAAESSEDPRLLAGYPQVKNVAPTTADAVFRTNKRGTIYWALTALTDGSVGEETLLAPTNNARVLQSGNLNATASNTDVTARLNALTRDGSYYVSAMLVDNRGRRSPVKAVAFTTPDDSTPAFAQGYPYTILTEDSNGEQVIQAMVMPTKDCRLYYALLPNNATAPTPADFRAAAISGNLGFGIVDVKKNVPFLIPRVNTGYLAEQTTYNLYLWLNDADNGKSSAITRLNVTTLDKTPPTIIHLTPGDTTANSANFTFSLDEPGTLFWAVVKHDMPFYAAIEDENGIEIRPDPEDLTSKIQVESGRRPPAISSGRAQANTAGTDVPFTVGGLQPQTRYDLYFVAKDRAGNYNVYKEELKPPIEFSTLDGVAPTVRQTFTHDGTPDGQQNPTPYPDTGINLVFSETVQGLSYDVYNNPKYANFLRLYQTARDATGDAKTAAKEALGNALHNHIKLFSRATNTEVPVRTASSGTNWVIDFREAVISTNLATQEMTISFPAETGVKLSSGASYYFQLENISDNSANMLGGNQSRITLPYFTTISARVDVKQTDTLKGTVDGTDVDFDMAFDLSPVSVGSVDPELRWDMLFYYTAPDAASSSIAFELYCNDNHTGWKKIGTSAQIQTFAESPRGGISIGKYFTNYGFEQLQQLRYREYGIKIIRIGTSSEPKDWTTPVVLDVYVVTSTQGTLQELARPDLTPAWETNKEYAIGNPSPCPVKHTFTDSDAPRFVRGYPLFDAHDESVDISIMLNRPGTCYYVVAPMGPLPIPTTYKGQNITTTKDWLLLDPDGSNFDNVVNNAGDYVTTPGSDEIMNPNFQNTRIKTGNIAFNSGATDIPPITGLEANREYIAYFVLRGTSMTSYSGVYAFRFKTQPITRPVIQINLASPKASISEYNKKDADGGWLIFPDTLVPTALQQKLVDGTVDITNRGTSDLDPAYENLWQDSYADLTILQAMSTNVRVGNEVVGTVFDVFVAKRVQDTIADNVINGRYGVGQNGGLTLNNRNNYVLDQDYSQWMDGGSNYWIVAVAKSPQGSAYAGAAAHPLFKRDLYHPLVTSVATTVDKWYPTYGEALNGGFTGKVTIYFDEDLYWKNSQNSTDLLRIAYTSTILGNPPLPSGLDPNIKGYQAAIALQLPGGALTLNGEDTPNADGSWPGCSNLTFTFSPAVRVGESVGLRTANLSDASGNSGLNDGNISLELKIVERTMGGQTMYGARFEFTNNTSPWKAANCTYSFS